MKAKVKREAYLFLMTKERKEIATTCCITFAYKIVHRSRMRIFLAEDDIYQRALIIGYFFF
jgi:hypothetical protein